MCVRLGYASLSIMPNLQVGGRLLRRRKVMNPSRRRRTAMPVRRRRRTQRRVRAPVRRRRVHLIPTRHKSRIHGVAPAGVRVKRAHAKPTMLRMARCPRGESMFCGDGDRLICAKSRADARTGRHKYRRAKTSGRYVRFRHADNAQIGLRHVRKRLGAARLRLRQHQRSAPAFEPRLIGERPRPPPGHGHNLRRGRCSPKSPVEMISAGGVRQQLQAKKLRRAELRAHLSPRVRLL